MSARSPLFLLGCLVPVSVSGACASIGATLGSGVGEAFLDRAPYYAGRALGPEDEKAVRVGHIPVAYQRGASQPEIFDPSMTDAMSELLERMTVYLDSLGVSTRVASGEGSSAAPAGARGIPPDVQFGCVPDPGATDDDCPVDEEAVLGRRDHRMRLAVGRPSPEWTEWMGAVMGEADVERVLVVTLEVGQYLPRQRGWRGSKEVELGTSHVVDLPWLTSLETPVSVLQLTGAVVGRDGRATRIGAEGLSARRTPITLSGFGVQSLISEEDVEELLTARRDDLPDRPLLWQAALRELVTQLTGRPLPLASRALTTTLHPEGASR